MKPLNFFAVIALVCATSSAVVFADEKPATPPVAKPATPAAPPAEKRPLPDINFTGTPLSECLDFLAEATSTNIVVDWKALDAAKVERDTPVTLKLTSNTRYSKALKLILQSAGGIGTLQYTLDDGVIQITTQEEADKVMVTRTYPIADLLFSAPDYTDAPTVDITQTSTATAGGSGGGGGGSSQQTFQQQGGNQSQANSAASRQQRADDIIKLITTTVRPEVWKDNGGTATISFFRDSLIVTAPRSVQELLSTQYR